MYKCVPGVVLIRPEESKISLGDTKPPSRSIKGKVVAVGADYTTDFGTIIKAQDYAKVGESVVFFTNDPEYDWVELDGERHYLVHFKDLRLRNG